jgi:hypothetical protein
VILLDACRDDPFAGQPQGEATKSVVTQRSGLTAPAKDSMHNILIAFATDAGKTARDGDDTRASPFTEALLRHLDTPGKALTSCLIAVRNEVRDATQFQQVPWSQDSLLREIILNPADTPPGNTPLVQPLPTVPPETVPQPDPPPVRKSPPVLPDAAPQPDAPPVRAKPPVLPDATPQPELPPNRSPSLALAVLLLLIAGLGGYFLLRSDPVAIIADPCVAATGVAALACRVPELDSADKTIRLETARQLEQALGDGSVSNADKAAIVAALLDLTATRRFAELSPDGRYNLLGRLASISSTLWQDPALIIQLDAAHRSIAALNADAGAVLGNQTTGFLEQWAAQVGYRPKNAVTIYPQFAGFVRSTEWLPLLDALSKGWGWKFQDSERTANAAGVAQIRYGPESMRPLALLIAAQFNGQIPPDTGQPAIDENIRATVAASRLRRIGVAQANMRDNQLEIWIGR